MFQIEHDRVPRQTRMNMYRRQPVSRSRVSVCLAADCQAHRNYWMSKEPWAQGGIIEFHATRCFVWSLRARIDLTRFLASPSRYSNTSGEARCRLCITFENARFECNLKGLEISYGEKEKKRRYTLPLVHADFVCAQHRHSVWVYPIIMLKRELLENVSLLVAL